MEASKFLRINNKSSQVEVIETITLEEYYNNKNDTVFCVFHPQDYIINNRKSLEHYLYAILQKNHDYQLIVKSDAEYFLEAAREKNNSKYIGNTAEALANPDSWFLIIDGIKFNVKITKAKEGYAKITSEETHREFNMTYDIPRNNFKMYQEFLPFLNYEKRVISMREALTSSNIITSKIEEATYQGNFGFKITVHSFEGESAIFEMFYSNKYNKFIFLHLFHPEGEFYSNGDDPCTFAEIEAEIEELQTKLNRYKKIEAKINAMKI